MNQYDIPSAQMLRKQAEWLAPARARMLRKAGIARRRNVLDLACGFGAATAELARRSGGEVTALDIRQNALVADPGAYAGADRVCADALHLPFAGGSFDLVFCQFVFLWIDAAPAVEEIHRVLRPGGTLAAIEPDYGGMMEYPPEIAAKEIWISALSRAGADPFTGRKLHALLHEPDWKTETDLLDRLMPPSPDRFTLLEELPLSDAEKNAIAKIKQADTALDDSAKTVHLPMFMVLAEKMP